MTVRHYQIAKDFIIAAAKPISPGQWHQLQCDFGWHHPRIKCLELGGAYLAKVQACARTCGLPLFCVLSRFAEYIATGRAWNASGQSEKTPCAYQEGWISVCVDSAGSVKNLPKEEFFTSQNFIT